VPAEPAGPFTVTMDPGTYTVQWYSVHTRDRAAAGQVTAGHPAAITFSPPFTPPEPAVLHLKNTAGPPAANPGG